MKRLFCDWCRAEIELAAHLVFAPLMEAGHQQTYEICHDCECLVRQFIEQQRRSGSGDE